MVQVSVGMTKALKTPVRLVAWTLVVLALGVGLALGPLKSLQATERPPLGGL
jgi:hypothetical protein